MNAVELVSALLGENKWKELASQPWPEDHEERQTRADQLNRYALINCGYPEDEVMAMTNMEVRSKLQSYGDKQ